MYIMHTRIEWFYQTLTFKMNVLCKMCIEAIRFRNVIKLLVTPMLSIVKVTFTFGRKFENRSYLLIKRVQHVAGNIGRYINSI